MVFTVSGMGLILFFTRWNESGAGIFLWMAKHIESLTAFRSSSRVIVVVHLLQVLVLSVLFSYMYQISKSLILRYGVLALSLFAAIEGLSLQQKATPIDRVLARSEGVLNAWSVAGDRPLLIFAPGAFNGSASMAHLDAWSAAIRSNRKSINGYSGSLPDSHNMFLLKPIRENAVDLVRRLGLDLEQVSIVESWGDRESELGIKRFDSDPISRLDGFGIQPVWWNYSFPVLGYPIDGIILYEFAPVLKARFALPDGTRTVLMVAGIREGAYSKGANSDGVGVHWSVISDDTTELINSTYLNPRDNLSQRGFLPYSFEVPGGYGRELLLEVDGGPDRDTAWDWLMIGELKAE